MQAKQFIVQESKPIDPCALLEMIHWRHDHLHSTSPFNLKELRANLGEAMRLNESAVCFVGPLDTALKFASALHHTRATRPCYEISGSRFQNHDRVGWRWDFFEHMLKATGAADESGINMLLTNAEQLPKSYQSALANYLLKSREDKTPCRLVITVRSNSEQITDELRDAIGRSSLLISVEDESAHSAVVTPVTPFSSSEVLLERKAQPQSGAEKDSVSLSAKDRLLFLAEIVESMQAAAEMYRLGGNVSWVATSLSINRITVRASLARITALTPEKAEILLGEMDKGFNYTLRPQLEALYGPGTAQKLLSESLSPNRDTAALKTLSSHLDPYTTEYLLWCDYAPAVVTAVGVVVYGDNVRAVERFLGICKNYAYRRLKLLEDTTSQLDSAEAVLLNSIILRMANAIGMETKAQGISDTLEIRAVNEPPVQPTHSSVVCFADQTGRASEHARELHYRLGIPRLAFDASHINSDPKIFKRILRLACGQRPEAVNLLIQNIGQLDEQLQHDLAAAIRSEDGLRMVCSLSESIDSLTSSLREALGERSLLLPVEGQALDIDRAGIPVPVSESSWPLPDAWDMYAPVIQVAVSVTERFGSIEGAAADLEMTEAAVIGYLRVLYEAPASDLTILLNDIVDRVNERGRFSPEREVTWDDIKVHLRMFRKLRNADGPEIEHSYDA